MREQERIRGSMLDMALAWPEWEWEWPDRSGSVEGATVEHMKDSERQADRRIKEGPA